MIMAEDGLPDCLLFLFLGDLSELGRVLGRYWAVKRRLAEGAQPEALNSLFEALEPFVDGVVNNSYT